ncbi:MAG: hypothetical protein M3282_06060 [Gemmatimonadota bacterium]|nr:hypothetical protein [Gemmatimonadota bacterium]
MTALETKLEDKLEEVIKSLVRDVAAGVHAMYRGEIRQQTAQVRMSAFVAQAREALLPLLAGSSGGMPLVHPMSVGSLQPPPSRASESLSAEEAAAITRCIMAWGPMGNPSEAAPDSRCAPGAKELVPNWGDREKAREALRRLAGS